MGKKGCWRAVDRQYAEAPLRRESKVTGVISAAKGWVGVDAGLLLASETSRIRP